MDTELTLGKALKQFISGYKPTSRKSYEYDLRQLCNFLGSTLPLASITSEDMLKFGELMDRKRYSIGTWNKRVKTARAFFNFYIREGSITENPARFLKTRTKKGMVDRDKAMSDNDLFVLIQYASIVGDERLLALILFCADTACRRGGAANLTWVKIDFTQRTATLTEKGDASRPVPFGELCAEALRNWQKKQDGPAIGYVFSKHGGTIRADSVSQMLRRACHKAKIRGRGVHSLRHRKGFQFAEHRLSPTTAQNLLGHSNIATTLNNYYPLNWDMVKAAGEELAIKTEVPTNPKIIKLRTS